MNRPAFVGRLLDFLVSAGFDGHVSIGDSSSNESLDAMNALIARLNGRLRIAYRYFSPTDYPNDSLCMKEMIASATTKYGVFCGDDDLVLPHALRACVRFLDGHPDYSAVHGYRIEYMLESAQPHGRPVMMRFAEELLLESEVPSRRWISYMRYPYSTQYYVHRTETWRSMYLHVDRTRLRYIGPELLPCSISALSGKIGELPEVSTLFQIHDQHVFSWHKSSLYELMLDPAWHESVRIFRSEVAKLLSEIEGLPAKSAETLVDRELWKHLMDFLSWQFFSRFPAEEGTFRRLTKKVISLRNRIAALFGPRTQDHMTTRATSHDRLARTRYWSRDLELAFSTIDGHSRDRAY